MVCGGGGGGGGDGNKQVIQFGYLVLFGWSWPLASLCAFANNLIELRSDLFKLSSCYQRLSVRDSSSIGSAWMEVLHGLTIISTITNFASLGVFVLFVHNPSTDGGDLTLMGWNVTAMKPIEKLFWIVFAEHLMIAIKSLLTWCIPDVPCTYL